MQDVAPEDVDVVDDEDRVEVLKRELELEQRRLELVKQCGLAFYKPHGKQHEFHSAGARARFRAFFAGNRAGKSTCGAAEDIAYALGERIWYPKGSPERTAGLYQRPVRILIVGETWDKVVDNFVNESTENPGKLFKFAPQGFFKAFTRTSKGVIDSIHCANGSFIKLYTVQSFLQNEMTAESSEWDVIHFDEPCPRDLFIGLSRGLMDTKGHCYFTLTGLGQPWIYDLFFPPDGEGMPGFSEHTYAVLATTYDNPVLDREAIATFEATLSPDERQARLYGKQLAYQGLVYWSFDLSKHVYRDVPLGWKAMDEPPEDYNIHISMDTHPQTPHALVFLAVSPLGTCYLYDCVFQKMTVDDLAELVKMKIGDRFKQLRRLVIDPSAFQTDPVHRVSLATELQRRGLWMLTPATKAKASGIMKLQSVFKEKDRFFVGYHCKRFLYEVTRYTFDKENKPVDKDDHTLEALYRIFIPDPIYTAPMVTEEELAKLTEVDHLQNFQLDTTFDFKYNE